MAVTRRPRLVNASAAPPQPAPMSSTDWPGTRPSADIFGIGELRGEGLEHGLVHADVIVPSLRLLVRLETRR
jgi:hypothetical protein